MQTIVTFVVFSVCVSVSYRCELYYNGSTDRDAIRGCGLMVKDQPNSWRKMRDVSENMPNFMENSRTEFQKFTGPQTLFRGAMLMQTKKSVE